MRVMSCLSVLLDSQPLEVLDEAWQGYVLLTSFWATGLRLFAGTASMCMVHLLAGWQAAFARHA